MVALGGVFLCMLDICYNLAVRNAGVALSDAPAKTADENRGREPAIWNCEIRNS